MNSIIKRIKKESNYTVIDNTVIRDTNLSWKAKGIHTFLMHCKDDFQISVNGLVTRAKCGRKVVVNALKELEQAKYVFRRQTRDDNGGYSNMVYYIFEHPQENFAIPEEDVLDSPCALLARTVTAITPNGIQISTKLNKELKETTKPELEVSKKEEQKLIQEEVKIEDLKGYSTMTKIHQMLTKQAKARFCPPKNVDNFKRYQEYRRVVEALEAGFTEQQLLDVTQFAIDEFLGTKYADSILSGTKVILRLSQQATTNLYSLCSKMGVQQRSNEKAGKTTKKEKEAVRNEIKQQNKQSFNLGLMQKMRTLEKMVLTYLSKKMGKDVAIQKTQDIIEAVNENEVEEYLQNRDKFRTLVES